MHGCPLAWVPRAVPMPTEGDLDKQCCMEKRTCHDFECPRVLRSISGSGMSGVVKRADAKFQILLGMDHQLHVMLCCGLEKSKECYPQNCLLEAWSQWGSTTFVGMTPCVGRVYRTRKIAFPPNECGRPCGGVMDDSKKVQDPPPCQNIRKMITMMAGGPPDGKLTEWSEWSITAVGTGKVRVRDVAILPTPSGQMPPASFMEVGRITHPSKCIWGA